MSVLTSRTCFISMITAMAILPTWKLGAATNPNPCAAFQKGPVIIKLGYDGSHVTLDKPDPCYKKKVKIHWEGDNTVKVFWIIFMPTHNPFESDNDILVSNKNVKVNDEVLGCFSDYNAQKKGCHTPYTVLVQTTDGTLHLSDPDIIVEGGPIPDNYRHDSKRHKPAKQPTDPSPK